jgi:hypothetical protein
MQIMPRIPGLYAVIGLSAIAFPQAASPQDRNLRIEQIDPNRSLSDIMKNASSTCTIVFVDGVPYMACPFMVPPNIETAIKQLKAAQ